MDTSSANRQRNDQSGNKSKATPQQTKSLAVEDLKHETFWGDINNTGYCSITIEVLTIRLLHLIL